MLQFVQGRVVLPLFAALFLQVVASAQTPEKGSDAMAKIGTTIERIRAEPSPPVRRELAWQLVQLIARQVGPEDIGTVDVGVIDDVAALLRDNDDVIRYLAAIALGRIGPPAERVVPALEEALRREPEPVPGPLGILPSRRTDDEMRYALERIRGRPATRDR